MAKDYPLRACSNRLQTIVFIGLALVGAGPVTALFGQASSFESYFHRVIDRDDGLPETQVNALAQTPDGYLWLGTRRGLVRYDGLRFQLWAPAGSGAMASEWINSLAADHRGRLWVGTTLGLFRIELGAAKPVPNPTLPTEAILSLLEDRLGRIWVGTATALYRSDGAGFRRIRGTTGEGIHALGMDAAGRIWFGGPGQFGVVSADSAALFPDQEARLGQAVLAIADDRRGGLWVGTRDGLRSVRIDSAGHPALAALIPTGDKQSAHPVLAVVTTGEGLVWAGTATGGVMTWDGTSLSRFGVSKGLSSRQIFSLFVDSRERVWAGSGAGMDRFQRTAFATFGAEQGLPEESIWAVLGRGRSVWATAFDGSVHQFTGGKFTPVVRSTEPDSGSIPAWPTRDGSLLVAEESRRIVRHSARGVQDLTAGLRLPDGPVLAIFEDHLGALWFSTATGLYRSTGGAALPMSARLGLPLGPGPRVMVEDSAGRLLLGRPGLTIVEGDSARRFGVAEGLVDLGVFALLPDGPNLWIATVDSGLFVLRHGRISQLGRRDHRLGTETLGIVADDLGYLWMTSSYGLLRASRAELEAAADGTGSAIAIRSFDRNDGLPTTEFNGAYQSTLFKDPDGRLWLPSYAGVVRVDPDQLRADSLPPRVLIERVVVDGVVRDPAIPLSLPPRVDRLEVAFTATEALVPARVRIQYRLIGVDRDWVEAGDKRTASYGPLEGGNYRFVVRAANEDGHWNPTEVGFSFGVATKVFDRPWFLPLVVLGLGLAGVAFNRMRVRQMQVRERELSDQVDDRTRDLIAARANLELRVEQRTAQLAEELAERKRLEHQLLQSQKLESIGRLAGGVAHEINNMMTGVLGFAELAEAAAHDRPDILADLQQIRQAGERAALVTKQLLVFARRQQAQRSAILLPEVIADLERFLHRLGGDQVKLAIELAADLAPVSADRAQVDQLIINLMMNARDAMPTGGRVTIRAANVALAAVQQVGSTELLPGDYVRIEVADEGVGMSAEVKARLFEPFFTTKEVSRGTGLSLAVCYGIATQHGGAIGVESELGKGSRFEVWLPVGVVVEEPARVTDPAPRGSEVVLVVEDEASVRSVAVRILSNLGYQVLEAPDGAAALEGFGHRLSDIDVVVTDVLMPRLGGVELARALRARRPDLPIVFMSGFAGRDSAWAGENALLGPMLAKPFTRAGLADAVRRRLDLAKLASVSQA